MKKQNIMIRFFNRNNVELNEYKTKLAKDMLNPVLLDDITFPEGATHARVEVNDYPVYLIDSETGVRVPVEAE